MTSQEKRFNHFGRLRSTHSCDNNNNNQRFKKTKVSIILDGHDRPTCKKNIKAYILLWFENIIFIIQNYLNTSQLYLKACQKK